MKKSATVLTLLLLISLTPVMAKKLTARLAYATYYAPGAGPYVETYLSVSGRSVVFAKNSNGRYQGTIQVGIIFKQDSLIRYSDKFNLLSQEIDDTSKSDFNFLDLQRISLPEGNYTFELNISDKNSGEKPFTSTQQVNIYFPPGKINISSIHLLESFRKTEQTNALSKNGFDLVPYVNNFFAAGMDELRFYAEIYQANKILADAPFMVSCYIEEYETKLTVEKFRHFSKQQAREVNMVLSEFNIKELPSGNYNLVVEVRSNKNDLLAMKETFFQRSNNTLQENKMDLSNTDISGTFAAGLTDSLRLRECIRSFRPVANAGEGNFEDFQLKKASLPVMQRYVYHFWYSRDPQNPEAAFRNYMEQVETVNKAYKTPMYKGYQTERGRVYLQYGAPNEVVKYDREPDTYPYEIWHYYKIKNQTNKVFIFYNTDLVTNDYRLLHSDMQGEPHEPQWQIILHKRSTQSRDYETKKTRQNAFGEHSNEYGTRKDE